MIHSSVLSPKVVLVAVEYDGRTGRERKEFTADSAARRFYAAKSKAGKNPRVVRATLS